jgi:Protein of unknown function (DUF1488)
MGSQSPNLERTVDFLLRDGQAEIPCRISFDALGRHAGVSELSWPRAARLLHWYRWEIDRIALARYAAEDFADGIVSIDVDDIGSPLGRR